MRVADGKTITATGKGEVIVPLRCEDGNLRNITKYVLLTPQLSNNIFSTSPYLKANPSHAVSLNSGSAQLMLDNGARVPLQQSQSLYWLIPGGTILSGEKDGGDGDGESAAQPRIKQTTMPFAVFHARMGHLGADACKALAHSQNIVLKGNVDECEVCARGKLAKKAVTSLANSPAVPLKPGQRIYMDIKGPLEHPGYNGDKFAFVYVDEATRITVVKTATSKDKCVQMTASALNEFATFSLCSIPVGQGSELFSDAEVVIQSSAMKQLLADRSISFRTSPPHTHELCGIVERAIQTLFNSVRCLLDDGGMPEQYWPLALHHACYIKNYTPTSSLGDKAPVHVLTGVAKSTNHLRIFSSAVFVKVDEAERQALDPKSRKGIYVGHSDIAGCARVLLLDCGCELVPL